MRDFDNTGLIEELRTEGESSVHPGWKLMLKAADALAAADAEIVELRTELSDASICFEQAREALAAADKRIAELKKERDYFEEEFLNR